MPRQRATVVANNKACALEKVTICSKSIKPSYQIVLNLKPIELILNKSRKIDVNGTNQQKIDDKSKLNIKICIQI